MIMISTGTLHYINTVCHSNILKIHALSHIAAACIIDTVPHAFEVVLCLHVTKDSSFTDYKHENHVTKTELNKHA